MVPDLVLSFYSDLKKDNETNNLRRTIMYRKKLIISILFMFLPFLIFAQTMTIDEAIRLTANELRQQLDKNLKIIIYDFSSNWRQLSNYVIDELNNDSGIITRLESFIDVIKAKRGDKVE